MPLKNTFFCIFFMVANQALSQELTYNPFEQNNYATFKTCANQNEKENCFKTILINELSTKFDYTLIKTRKNKEGVEVYFSFKVDSLGQKSTIFFYDSQELELKDKLSLIILKLPEMVPAIEEEIAGISEFILKLHMIPEKAKIFSIIDIKTRFTKPKLLKEHLEAGELDMIEKAPIFPGCAAESEKDLRVCFQKSILSHISKNFRYPEFAQKSGIQGKVVISFIVNKEGFMTKLKANGPHPTLELEAIRIFSKLPRLTPGYQRGLLVNVPFSLPITFRLQ